jgi:archaellum component FlaC
VPWNKLKGLFIVSDAKPSPGPSPSSSEDQAAIDAAIARYQVPPEPAEAVLPATDPAQLSGTVDFQALYDRAGIPNTDEVESLESFLHELDNELPQTSKLAAAKAFLKATSRSSVDVLNDAARKIKVVRAVEASKIEESRSSLAQQQAAIDDLQKQIDELRTAMEASNRDLEGVRSQCTTEEARLQGARMFFGAMDKLVDPSTTPPRR